MLLEKSFRFICLFDKERIITIIFHIITNDCVDLYFLIIFLRFHIYIYLNTWYTNRAVM